MADDAITRGGIGGLGYHVYIYGIFLVCKEHININLRHDVERPWF